MDVLLLILIVCLLNMVLCAATLWYIHRINSESSELMGEISDFKQDLGGVFNFISQKLEKFEDLVPDIEAPNPLVGIIQSYFQNQSPLDRGATGQFVRAEVIHPSDD